MKLSHNTEKNMPPKKVQIERLEMHVVHACNIRCKNCSHYCDIGYARRIDHDAALESIGEWSRRISISRFSLLGGEPLLEKRVVDYIEKVAAAFPYADRRLVTNGILLYKYDDSFAQLIKSTNTRLVISLHVVPDQYREKQMKSFATLKEWIKKYSLKATIKEINTKWFKLYHGNGYEIRPYNDNNAAESRKHCLTPCVNLHEGTLWKCPPLAYLPMIIEKLHYKRDWAPYLAYRPLQISASDEALASLSSDSSCCGMCPANPKLDMD